MPPRYKNGRFSKAWRIKCNEVLVKNRYNGGDNGDDDQITFDEALALVESKNEGQIDDCSTPLPSSIGTRATPAGHEIKSPIVPVDGARIIDYALFAKRLEQGCEICGMHLSMSNVSKEVKKGLASIFHILCINCDSINKIYTSKTHKRPEGRDNRSAVFNHNTKVAVGKCIKRPPHTHSPPTQQFLSVRWYN